MNGACSPTPKARGVFAARSPRGPNSPRVGCEMTVAYVSDGDVNPAKGVRGGATGGSVVAIPESARDGDARTVAGLRRGA